MLDSQVPQRLNQAIEAALESHATQRQALSALKSRREELVGKLRSLGVEDAPDAFGERVVDPLRKWRNGINATNRLIKEDAQRDATLQKELLTARTDRDSALAGCQIETPSDDASSWLLAKPGFESEAAADWERKAREMAALLRPAGIALKEKAEEVRAAREAVDSAERIVQQAMKSSNLDVRREDLDEWAACYAELCALPRAKLAFLHKSSSARCRVPSLRFFTSQKAQSWCGNWRT
jgi:hypothetical protein